MYKAPQNSNRVKSIKNKFENIEKNSRLSEKIDKNEAKCTRNANTISTANNEIRNTSNTTKKTEDCVHNKEHNNFETKNVLSRQLSDPVKRNIRRTHAFRLDKNVEKTPFQRNNACRRSTERSTFEMKTKPFSGVLKNCDSNKNIVSILEDDIPNSPNFEFNVVELNESKPVFIKSKSLHDFMYIRSKFDSPCCKDEEGILKVNDELKSVNLSLLYSEPIPKSLRNTEKRITHKEDIPFNIDTIYNTSTLKLNNVGTCNMAVTGLTDTLKSALKKPLPSGPAPKKPPRTFQHSAHKFIERNKTFAHVMRDVENKSKITLSKRGDPKYMLNKLENALKNNKLRARKQLKVDISTTSGEDSDDSLLSHSKSQHTSKFSNICSGHPFYNAVSDFDCFSGNGCLNPIYKRNIQTNVIIKDCSPEPVYAEPVHKKINLPQIQNEMQQIKNISTNRLYYTSTSVLDMSTDYSYKKQISADDSSLSSFTSEIGSTPSPMDGSNAKIKILIESFETIDTKNESYRCVGNSHRVEHLKKSLTETLEQSFNCDNTEGDSDSDRNCENKVCNIIAKFQTYVKNMPKYCQSKANKDKLFYCCLIIEKVRDCIHIKLKFPSDVEIPQNIESLCFPENSETSFLESSNSSQTYSLLVTNDKGERTFGYCRRVLPEGSALCLPLAYCILSKYRAPRFYKKILEELESRHGMQNKYRDNLINQFYNNKFPKPGECIRINLSSIDPSYYEVDNIKRKKDTGSVNKTSEYGTTSNIGQQIEKIQISENNKSVFGCPSNINSANNEQLDLILSLDPNTRYEDADLKILHRLPCDILLKIFSSLLLERKVILISSLMSELSSCVDSLQTILYPFTWHHTFIPILPESLWDIVESPTPVICGVLSDKVVEHYHIENAIVVNLDTKSVLNEEGDENTILSGSMQKVWKRSIALANKATASKEFVQSVYLADAYLQVFVTCFKKYRDYIVDGQFEREEFINNVKSKGVRRFLRMFTETYMFHAFIDCALNNSEDLEEFDKKISMYGSDESDIILDKLLDWKR